MDTQTVYDPAEPDHRRIVWKISLRLIPLMIIVYSFGYLDRLNIGVAALRMNQDLGLSKTAFGIAVGCFSIGYTLCQIPSNFAIARIGARLWLGLLMLSWGVVTAATAYVQSGNQLIWARIILGTIEAGLYPGLVFYASIWFPPQLQARALTLIGLPIALVFGTPVSALIVEHGGGWFGLAGWRTMFLVEGIATALVGFVVLKWLTSWPGEARWLSAGERGFVQSTTKRGGDAAEVGFPELLQCARNPRIWLYSLAYACIISGFYALLFFTPQILDQLGKSQGADLSVLMVGMLSALPHLIAFVLVWLYSSHADRTGERKWHILVAAVIGASGVLLCASSSALPMMIAGLILAMFGLGGSLSSLWPLALGDVSARQTSVAIAFINMIGTSALVIVPIVVGALGEGRASFEYSFFLLAALMAMGAALTLTAARPQSQVL